MLKQVAFLALLLFVQAADKEKSAGNEGRKHRQVGNKLGKGLKEGGDAAVNGLKKLAADWVRNCRKAENISGK